MKRIELIQPAAIDRSAIEWTGPTWNPWQGCERVSEACKRCYMFRDMKRYGKDPNDIHRSAAATFERPLKWQREVEAGVRTGQDRLVFTCSWSDWFIRQADAWRGDAWAIVRRCPGLTFQILTKRADRIADHLPSFWDEIKGHVWLGVTVENDRRARERLPYLEALRLGGCTTFVSYEPALGPVDWEAVALRKICAFDWLIAGGESGGQARPSHPDWFRDAKEFCDGCCVAFFFKQWGEWLPISEMKPAESCRLYVSRRKAKPYEDQATVDEFYGRRCTVKTTSIGYDGNKGNYWRNDGRLAYQTFRVGRRAAGRLLDGVEHNSFPKAWVNQ